MAPRPAGSPDAVAAAPAATSPDPASVARAGLPGGSDAPPSSAPRSPAPDLAGPPPGDSGPAAAVPDLPPWTDPPTGQVPAVLDRGTSADEDDPWAAVLGGAPAWREHAHEWDEVEFEPALLADEATRLGALRRPDTPDDAEVPGDEPRAAGEGGTGAGDGSDQDSGRRRLGLRARVPGHRRRRAPDHQDSPASTPDAGGRNVPLAVATGAAVAAVALVCFALGAVATLVLSMVVVVAAAAEAYASLRRAGYRPATLVGLVGAAGLMVVAYTHGLPGMPVVLMLVVVVTMLWYLFGLGHGSAVRGIGSTLTVFLWIGLLGSFAALLVAPSLFPHRYGVAFWFGAVAAVVAADVGALVVGRWLGRHHLAPTVSPNKTWEGLAGGAVLAIVVSALLTGHIQPWDPAKGAVLGLVVAVVAPLGDLCESLVKRDLGLKDMGSLLPGHGGLVDRFDALLFALPATFVVVRLFHLG